MQFITVKAAAEKWGVSERRVQILCRDERIKGAYRFGKSWMIPAHAVLPNARRMQEPIFPMPRKSPFLDMTNLYDKAGGSEECAEMLVNQPEAHALFEAQIAYRRGEIDKVYDKARYFLSSHSGFYAMLGGGMLLAHCAIWRGDVALWNEAKRHICDAPCESKEQSEIISLALATIDSSVLEHEGYPEWFTMGNFEKLPADAHPAAKVYYTRYLYMEAYAIASGQKQMEGVQGLALMGMLPNAIEPMITQAVVDKTVICEIFLRLSCAVAYYYSGRKVQAVAHIDKAVALVLSDGLYGILTEYVRLFDGLLEERIGLMNPSAMEIVKALHATYIVGWSKLSGQIRQKNIATNLTQREHECAKLFAFGFKPKEIASMLYISESTVRYTLSRVVEKTGILSQDEFSSIL